MTAAVVPISASKDTTVNSIMEKEEQQEEEKKNNNSDGDHKEKNRDKSHDHHDNKQEEEDGVQLKSETESDLGPQFSVKEKLANDKDNESLGKRKDQILGREDDSAVGEVKYPQVQIVSITIMCPGRPDVVLPSPFASTPKARLFTIKEGSRYRLKVSFIVSNNTVRGLKYKNSVWKAGVRVDNSKVTLGAFGPRKEPYTYELEEDTTPSGIFARGLYSGNTKVIDDDGKCYLDIRYYFEIQKNWPPLLP